MTRSSPGRSNAIRVALAATVVLGAVYVILAATIDLVITTRMTDQLDAHLDAVLTTASSRWETSHGAGLEDGKRDLDDAPVLLWVVPATGAPKPLGAHQPNLARNDVHAHAATVRLSGKSLRVASARSPGGSRLVAAQSLARVHHARSVLLIAELVLAPFILGGTFGIALLIGLRAVAPVEAMRRRQLEFTSDASHELRTPLSVIGAEVDLALDRDRESDYYRSSLERIGGEADRLHRIVEDMLWLARFDSTPPEKPLGLADVKSMAEHCVTRFRSIAAARDISLTVHSDVAFPALVRINPEWLDQLIGVLLDNALGYAAGQVRLSVVSTTSEVYLIVEDNGPGIPESERTHIFDRFRRASTKPGGAGLGLAIADAVVGSTGGRWAIATSPFGGAKMQITWPKADRSR